MKRKFNKEHKAWRAQVLERDGNHCVMCPKDTYLNAHHLIPNTIRAYEFHVDNGITLCATHHTLGTYSAHKNPLWFSQWLKENRPELYHLAIMRLPPVSSNSITLTG